MTIRNNCQTVKYRPIICSHCHTTLSAILNNIGRSIGKTIGQFTIVITVMVYYNAACILFLFFTYLFNLCGSKSKWDENWNTRWQDEANMTWQTSSVAMCADGRWTKSNSRLSLHKFHNWSRNILVCVAINILQWQTPKERHGREAMGHYDMCLRVSSDETKVISVYFVHIKANNIIYNIYLTIQGLWTWQSYYYLRQKLLIVYNRM